MNDHVNGTMAGILNTFGPKENAPPSVPSKPLFDVDLSSDAFVLTLYRKGCGDMTLYKDEAETLLRLLAIWTKRMVQFVPPSNSLLDR